MAAGIFLEFPHAKLIHVDVDHSEIGRNYAPDLGILADARTFLQQSWRSWSGATSARRPAQALAWRDREVAERVDAFTRPNFDIHASPLRPERVVATALGAAGQRIISLDSGVHHNWYMQFWEARQPQTMLNTWGFSGMGFGPAASSRQACGADRPCVASAATAASPWCLTCSAPRSNTTSPCLGGLE